MTDYSTFEKNINWYRQQCDIKKSSICLLYQLPGTIIHEMAVNIAKNQGITYYQALMQIDLTCKVIENEC